MDRALVSQEFSLMLAGFLVASSAAAMVGVYFLMSDYMVYVHQNELLLRDQFSSDFVMFYDSMSQLSEPDLVRRGLANLSTEIAPR